MEDRASGKKPVSAARTVAVMMVITLAGKLLGLLRDRMLTVHYGTGMEASAFLTASRIPRVFFDAVFASAISPSFIPVFSGVLTRRSKKEALEFSQNFLSVMTAFCLALTVLGMILARPLTLLFADGYEGETLALCVRLTRIMFPTVVFTGAAFSFVGILQSLDEFNLPAAMSLVSNGIVILYYLTLNDRFGITGLAVTFLVAWAMQAVIQIPALLKKGFRFRLRLRFGSPEMREVYRLMLPVMVSTWVMPINQTINSKFGSRLFEGSGVSAIELSYNLYTVVIGVFVLSLTNYIFPKLSRERETDAADAFAETLRGSIHTTLFFVLPMTAGMMLLAGPLVGFLYGGGKFDAFSHAITTRALTWISLGMGGYALQAIFSRAFFAGRNGTAPLIAGAVSILVNVLLCWLLMGTLDVSGLAIASAVSSTANALVLWLLLERQGTSTVSRALVADGAKMLLATLLMAGAVYGLGRLLAGKGNPVILACSALGGVVVYFIAAYLLNLEEARFCAGLVRSFRRKGGSV